jgi:holo-[acyl-carrier protein] synthase
MPLRIGTDLVAVSVVRDSLADHADRYLERVYTGAEIRDSESEGGPAPHRLAARFAAKEAALKVLRPGETAVPWTEIEVVREPAGWVRLALSGAAASLAEAGGLSNFALSISHEGDYATAVVVAEVGA